MGDYSAICELRGRAKDGQGCTSQGVSPLYCSKRHSRGRCMTSDVDALVDPSIVGKALKLYNSPGLARWRSALALAASIPAMISCHGDSITAAIGVEDPSNLINNDVSDYYGWPGQLRSLFAKNYNTGLGGVILPQFAGADPRVAVAGASNLSTTGANNSGVSVTSVSNAGGVGTVTFTTPAATSIDVLIYQDTGTPNTGALLVSIDGGADVAIANTSQKYRVVNIANGLANVPHTVVVKGNSSTNASYVMGCRYHSNKGVIVGRWARGGWTILDSFGLGALASLVGNASGLERVADAYGAYGAHLTIVGYMHNDCGQQLVANASGIFSTPEAYRNYAQNVVDRVTAKGVGSVLLLPPELPPVQAPPAGGADFLAYHEVAKQVANSNLHCAALDIYDRVGDPVAAVSKGFFSSPATVHPSVLGYTTMADYIYQALTA